MNTNHLKVIFMSDVHLFHRRTPTWKIAEELKKVFKPSLTDIDIVFIAGDLFDRVTTLPTQDVADAEDLIFYILQWCRNTDTQLRILEGTPSHDWRQAAWLDRLNQLTNINADLIYQPKLNIEYNEKFDLNILYVPDEWDEDTEVTYKDVLSLLKKRNLSQVDLAIMHGNFRYQLPEVAKAPKHKEEDYLSIVKYYICIGHVHRHSFYDRILAQGSFSRLAHGEEEPKGYILANLYSNGEMSWEFIENKDAAIYRTIDISHLNTQESTKLIDTQLSNVPQNSYVRLQAESTHPFLVKNNDIIKRYPLYHWSYKAIEERTKEDSPREDSLTDFNEITLTRDNIIPLLLSRLEKRNLSLDSQEITSIIQGAIDAIK